MSSIERMVRADIFVKGDVQRVRYRDAVISGLKERMQLVENAVLR